MSDPVRALRRSLAYSGAVGVTVPATQVASNDRLLDPARFPSEGYWAFCRFESDAIPAVRLGFQRGGFNAGPQACIPNPSYLQLHLEVMTREGALLWLPSGLYPAERVESAPTAFSIRLANPGHEIFQFAGWPLIQCDEDLRIRALVHEPIKTRSMANSSMALPGSSAMYSSARSQARRSAGDWLDAGSGTRSVTGTTIPGLVPQVTKGARSSACSTNSRSKVAPGSVASDCHWATARSQFAPVGLNRRPLR